MGRELPLLAGDRVALALREGRQTRHRAPIRWPDWVEKKDRDRFGDGWRTKSHERVGSACERAQDISEEDARAEGVAEWMCSEGIRAGIMTYANREAFAAMLSSLYPDSWDRNDWLWCCELELNRERSGVGHG